MQIGTSIVGSISPNFTTPVGNEDYMNSDKNLKKESEKEETKTKENSQSSSSTELSQDEKRLVGDLQSRDAEVRAHEAAHQAAGGGMTGGASYTYQQGPDGRMYAIGGEVSISFKSGSTPQETIQNAQAVISAAMAPANPSPQDYSVASSARVMMMKAQQQLARELQDEMLAHTTYKNEADKNNSEEIEYKARSIDIAG